MADGEAVDALMETIRGAMRNAAWKTYHSSNPNADLSQADLSNLDLLEIDFRGCNLSGAKLFNTDLAGADLTGGILTYTDMRRANLANAFLTKVQASGVNLTGANLVDTNLDGADLRGARLGGAHLVGASLIGADLRACDLRGANLKFTNLKDAFLEGANVEDATLTNVEVAPAVLKTLRNVDKAIITGVPGHETAQKKGLTPEEDYENLFLEQDCYRILGIDKKADLDEITKAYRQRAKEYHPDRVHNLGEKIRYVAQKEFERIQHAYKSLSQLKAAPEAAFDGGAAELAAAAGGKKPQDLTLQDYVKLAKTNPNNEIVFFNLGVRYFRVGQYDKAIQAYQRCLRINSSNRNAEYNIRVAAMMQSLVQK